MIQMVILRVIYLVLGQMLHPTLLLTKTTQYHLKKAHMMKLKHEIIDEFLNEDNEPATPAIPIVNYAGDVETADDYANGWEWQLEDKGSRCGPFLLDSKLNIQSNANQPETFFEALFDASVWTTLAQDK